MTCARPCSDSTRVQAGLIAKTLFVPRTEDDRDRIMKFRNDLNPEGERVGADIEKSRETTWVTEHKSGLGSQSSPFTQEGCDSSIVE